jgi:hypothetical protein
MPEEINTECLNNGFLTNPFGERKNDNCMILVFLIIFLALFTDFGAGFGFGRG